ncbi:type II toxin-antitoxin system death-on-curing family toxin [Lactobacillus ultunensis]|uniref:Death-on-curing family protein n=1 Tax=Lactobacillus ultunensis DSM 16047 TaxID=525365 RepID=C2EQP9_9LACO|nr:type II toxin-antitoxin system death-on-curing family toxin [Lactobacillus ultunensis]EEJ71052.1 death-on-curing family protein [Lactobacillus ultunensis DSM 16047]KRL82828.1 death-on-curing (DOC) family protein [Lactobacillus ultunensis DSM 16047]QQP28819.1 type II toxin-antitoxin system death-on-curing family toxin [Lactobacillus ultunensis]
MDIKYLSESELIYVNKMVLNFTDEEQEILQYPEGLSIITQQPRQVLFDHELYPSIWLKAAFILQKITKKHIFADGNKRTAYVATKLFLKKNGYHLKMTKQEGIVLMLDVTTKDDTEKEMIKVAEVLKKHCSVIE